MILQKVLIAVLAGTALFTPAPAFSHDDDDEDDWQERRGERRDGKNRKHGREYHRYYYYGPPPIVIYRDPPPPPYLDRGRPRAKPPQPFPKESPADSAAEDLQAYQDSVETHERNIEALKRELNNLNR